MTTLYVIAYDISSDKRRNKIFKILSSYGEWIQFSLFECHLSDKQYLQLRYKLSKLLNADEADNVRFYQLCVGCKDKVDIVGGEKPQDPVAIIL